MPKHDFKRSFEGLGRAASQPDLTRGVLCKKHLLGRCILGDRCSLAHSVSELSEAKDLWKTRLCIKFLHGECEVDEDCPFAHGTQELRSPRTIYRSRQTRQSGNVSLAVSASACNLECPVDLGRHAEPIVPTGSSRRKVKVELIYANPHEVFFTCPRIIDRFSCGRSLESTIQDLSSGSLAPEDIPLIRVVRRKGRLQTLDHRRLYAFRAALPLETKIPVKLIVSDYFAETLVPPDAAGRRGVAVDRSLPDLDLGYARPNVAKARLASALDRR